MPEVVVYRERKAINQVRIRQPSQATSSILAPGYFFEQSFGVSRPPDRFPAIESRTATFFRHYNPLQSFPKNPAPAAPS
jgi:hypothetical protein